VLGPNGLSRFKELSRRAAARTAILYALDLIEHDGEDLRNHPLLDRKAALGRLLRETEAGILLKGYIAEDGAIVFAHACRLGAEGIVSKRINSTYQSGPCRVWIKVRNPSRCSGSAVRYGMDERQAAGTGDDLPQEQIRRCVRKLEARRCLSGVQSRDRLALLAPVMGER
jgi:hypothetical protein